MIWWHQKLDVRRSHQVRQCNDTYQRQNRCWQWRHLLKKMEELGREIIILQGRSFGVGVQYWLFISCLNVDKSWWMHFIAKMRSKANDHISKQSSVHNCLGREYGAVSSFICYLRASPMENLYANLETTFYYILYYGKDMELLWTKI